MSSGKLRHWAMSIRRVINRPIGRGRGAIDITMERFSEVRGRRAMRARPFLVAMVFALGSVPLFPGLEWAQQSTSQYVMMTWSFKSTPPDIVYLQLYGQDNKNVWPAPDKYYKLAGRAAHKVRIRCSLGEKICYGAWT